MTSDEDRLAVIRVMSTNAITIGSRLQAMRELLENGYDQEEVFGGFAATPIEREILSEFQR